MKKQHNPVVFSEVMQTMINYQLQKTTVLLSCGHRVTFDYRLPVSGRVECDEDDKLHTFLECFKCQGY